MFSKFNCDLWGGSNSKSVTILSKTIENAWHKALRTKRSQQRTLLRSVQGHPTSSDYLRHDLAKKSISIHHGSMTPGASWKKGNKTNQRGQDQNKYYYGGYYKNNRGGKSEMGELIAGMKSITAYITKGQQHEARVLGSSLVEAEQQGAWTCTASSTRMKNPNFYLKPTRPDHCRSRSKQHSSSTVVLIAHHRRC